MGGTLPSPFRKVSLLGKSISKNFAFSGGKEGVDLGGVTARVADVSGVSAVGGSVCEIELHLSVL